MGLEGWDSEELLDTLAVAALLKLPSNTVKHWRHIGVGPPWFYLGPRTVRYRKSEVVAWLEAQLASGGGERS